MTVLAATLSPIERQALERFATRVRDRFADRIVKLVVFGSRARGDVHEESDIDVAIILRGEVTRADRKAIVHLATDIALDAPSYVELSPRVLAEREHRELVAHEWRIGLDIEREGISV